MSEKQVLIVATFVAKPGKSDALYEVLKRCILPSRKEAGNLHYDLYRSTENPDIFLFHECWKSAAAIVEHEAQPHFQALLAGVESLITVPPVISKI